MKFENKEYVVGEAYDWINEKGYWRPKSATRVQIPAREIEVWSHDDAVHDWVLVFGDWNGQWEKVECIPYVPFVPLTCIEPWDCIEAGTFERLGAESLGEIDLFMLKMEKEWLEEEAEFIYEQESRGM